MNALSILVEGRDRSILAITDHASNHVPADIDLGIDNDVLGRHMAVDIGSEAVTRRLCKRLDCPAVVAGLSRLVVDLNRDADDTAAIPVASDGVAIPGNMMLDEGGRAERIALFHAPYHQRLAELIAEYSPTLILSVHSFTPRLETAPPGTPTRRWQVGVLYNQDDRAARIAIPLLGAAGVVTGDNEPYSGKILNATMNRHAEANGIPYLGLEIRQDLIGDDRGATHWGDVLAKIVDETRNRLA